MSKCDAIIVQMVINVSCAADQVVGQYEGTSALGVDPKPDHKPADVGGGVSGFLSWLGDDAHAINRDEVNARLHTDTPILLPDEVIKNPNTIPCILHIKPAPTTPLSCSLTRQ